MRDTHTDGLITLLMGVFRLAHTCWEASGGAVHLFIALSRYFGFLALRLYAPGTLSENAFHTSFSGQSTAMNDTYRRVWRIGQAIGWTIIVLVILAIVALIAALV